MANHASAKKRIRQTERRAAVNRTRISTVRSSLRKVEEAIAGGDQSIAQEAFRDVQPQLMRCVTKGVMHRNTVSRKLSRLSSRVKGMSA